MHLNKLVCKVVGHDWHDIDGYPKKYVAFIQECKRCNLKRSFLEILSSKGALSKIGKAMIKPLRQNLDYKGINNELP